MALALLIRNDSQTVTFPQAFPFSLIKGRDDSLSRLLYRLQYRRGRVLLRLLDCMHTHPPKAGHIQGITGDAPTRIGILRSIVRLDLMRDDHGDYNSRHDNEHTPMVFLFISPGPGHRYMAIKIAYGTVPAFGLYL